MTNRELAAALRCTASPDSECRGEACPFYLTEKLNEELKQKTGREAWGSCDVDGIALQAADRLDEMSRKDESK